MTDTDALTEAEKYKSDGYYITSSRALAANQQVVKLLGQKIIASSKKFHREQKPDAVVCWGKKPSAEGAEAIANRLALPLLRLEDAFLRSLQLGHQQQPCGIVVDGSGIYYDPDSDSDLFRAIRKPLEPKQRARAQELILRWRSSRVSKYNHCRTQTNISVDYGRPYVLLVDQTFNDASVAYGKADSAAFTEMLASAKRRFPEHLIVIKTHPDVIAGTKQGYLGGEIADSDDSVRIEARSINPPDLIQFADAVFCVTSQVGFEALIWGVPVYTFGMPFYAGWGLTTDAKMCAQRNPVPLEQLVHAALIDYARYWHPQKQEVCSVEALIDWIVKQKRWREQFPEQLLVERFPRWKRDYLQQFMSGSTLTFLPRNSKLPRNENCVVWGNKQGLKRIRVEDGFVRSVGLGADLVAPKSWVFDDIGMYYDARSPSRLEHILNKRDFSKQVLTRANKLRQRLIENAVSKYNVGDGDWERPKNRNKVILVPGQVESDASVRFGSPEIKTNVALLRAVRQREPAAFIVYKPHPDVAAGLRRGDVEAAAIESICDELVINQDMALLLREVDEVHTMTSLTGFEAILRDIHVVCYGLPFYAGWGVTEDLYECSRRHRQRTVDELVAAALIDYPRYLSRRSGHLADIEDILDEIDTERRASQRTGLWHAVSRQFKRYWLRLHRF